MLLLYLGLVITVIIQEKYKSEDNQDNHDDQDHEESIPVLSKVDDVEDKKDIEVDDPGL